MLLRCIFKIFIAALRRRRLLVSDRNFNRPGTISYTQKLAVLD